MTNRLRLGRDQEWQTKLLLTTAPPISNRNPSYERRLVLYCDILGWRDELKRAGNDPTKLGDLRRVLLYSSRLGLFPARAFETISTFSDNVVISTPAKLKNVKPLQLFITALGFLVRGAIVVGDILHDREVVFGPALVQAYELESQITVVPRLLLIAQS